MCGDWMRVRAVCLLFALSSLSTVALCVCLQPRAFCSLILPVMAAAPLPLPIADDDSSRPYALLLFDVEGTTTPISFVKEVLFPYVRANVRDYLRRTYATSQQTRDDVEALKQLAAEDLRAGAADAPQISAVSDASDEAQLSALFSAVETNVLWQMSSDRKSTALKALQGHMWAGGYESGELKGQLFGGAEGEVAQWLRQWHAAGYALGVYSSGSVGAQQLLFSHSDAGNLQPLFRCNFDTVVGMKQQSGSYATIAARVGLPPNRVLFFTDIWGEAYAALQAGVHAVLLDRPGNGPLPAEQSSVFTFPVARSFAEVQEWMELKKQQKGPLHELEEQMRQRAASSSAAGTAATPAAAAQVDTSKGTFNTF
jgi:enolase-phosphatase E1